MLRFLANNIEQVDLALEPGLRAAVSMALLWISPVPVGGELGVLPRAITDRAPSTALAHGSRVEL